MSTLGNRIKFFRKRAKISQFELEGKIGASAGSLSRIESGEVNPTKETLEKIVKSIGLNVREENYLLGKTAQSATDSEVAAVSDSLRETLNSKKQFAYLVDERWRILNVADNLLKIIGYSSKDEFLKRAYKKTIPQLLIDPDIGIKKLFDEKYYKETLFEQLYFYNKEVGFMQDDEYYQNTIKDIYKSPLASGLWKEVLKADNNRQTLFIKEEPLVYFNLFGFKVRLRYSRQPLFDYPNFEIIEYHIENPILKRLYSMFNL